MAVASLHAAMDLVFAEQVLVENILHHIQRPRDMWSVHNVCRLWRRIINRYQHQHPQYRKWPQLALADMGSSEHINLESISYWLYNEVHIIPQTVVVFLSAPDVTVDQVTTTTNVMKENLPPCTQFFGAVAEQIFTGSMDFSDDEGGGITIVAIPRSDEYEFQTYDSNNYEVSERSRHACVILSEFMDIKSLPREETMTISGGITGVDMAFPLIDRSGGHASGMVALVCNSKSDTFETVGIGLEGPMLQKWVGEIVKLFLEEWQSDKAMNRDDADTDNKKVVLEKSQDDQVHRYAARFKPSFNISGIIGVSCVGRYGQAEQVGFSTAREGAACAGIYGQGEVGNINMYSHNGDRFVTRPADLGPKSEPQWVGYTNMLQFYGRVERTLNRS